MYLEVGNVDRFLFFSSYFWEENKENEKRMVGVRRRCKPGRLECWLSINGRC